MTHFRNGIRGTSLEDLYGRRMPIAANNLTDEEVVILSDFIATLQPRIVAEQQPMDANVERGTSICQSRCASCHGIDATGNEALGGPRLGGQENVYIARQMRNFREGIRGAYELDVRGQQIAAPEPAQSGTGYSGCQPASWQHRHARICSGTPRQAVGRAVIL